MALGYLTPIRRGQAARSSPGSSLFDLNRQMNRLFDDMFNQEGDNGFYGRSGMAVPAMDIHQTDTEVQVTAELPGVKEDDIDIVIEDGILSLRGEKKSSRTDKDGGYRERNYGSFERHISLPNNVDEENCSADFSDGILTITLPKSEEKQRGRRISLGSNTSREKNSELTDDRQKTNEKKAEKKTKSG